MYNNFCRKVKKSIPMGKEVHGLYVPDGLCAINCSQCDPDKDYPHNLSIVRIYVTFVMRYIHFIF